MNDPIQLDFSTYDEREKREQEEQTIREATAAREAMEAQEETATADPEPAAQTEKKEEEKLTDEELSAKQKKIDLNKNGKVDGDDLKKLRAKADKKEETVVEKTEYVEYKFKNKNDAMAAKKYFDGIQLMGFDVNDDGASKGELAVDAGNKDMTKYHKEIMKKFRGVKVVTTEKKEVEVSEEISEQVETLAQKAAKAISDMWAEASKSPKEEEEETPKKKESKKTTMTGKPMADVEINPKSKTEDK